MRSNGLLAGSLALSLVAASLSGCRSGGGTGGKVSGKVTYQGKDVTGGTIKFYPPGDGAPIQGAINPNGTYSLLNVPQGKSKVTIETESIKPAANLPPEAKAYMEKNPNSPRYVPIPANYGDSAQTPLTADVGKGETKKDFELQ